LQEVVTTGAELESNVAVTLAVTAIPGVERTTGDVVERTVTVPAGRVAAIAMPPQTSVRKIPQWNSRIRPELGFVSFLFRRYTRSPSISNM
jgi:hypothetical protein